MTNRRDFFKQFYSETRDSLVKSAGELVKHARPPAKDNFFDSYENSYALTLAYPREFFEEMALTADIPYEGRDVLAIVRDLHDKGLI